MKELEIQIKWTEECRFVLFLNGNYIDSAEGKMLVDKWIYLYSVKPNDKIELGLSLEGKNLDKCSVIFTCNEKAQTFEKIKPTNVDGTFAEIMLRLTFDSKLNYKIKVLPKAKRKAALSERIMRSSEDMPSIESLDPPNFEVPVFFATDRNRLDKAGKVSFGIEHGPLCYGKVLVSIPQNKEMGKVPRPIWWKLEFKENPDKHVMIVKLEVTEKDDFFISLRKTVARASENDAFIFVHGYNVSFEEAAWRTAQIAHDVQFGGAPILYSWPSRASTFGYISDVDNVDFSIPSMVQFLKDVREKTDAKKLHIIAHSMGNRGLTAALKELSEKDYFEDFQFSEIILAAPDIDADIFINNIAPKLSGAASGRITLYASDKDNALRASRLLRARKRRAGDAGPNIVCVKGIDTVDASHVDTDLLGHGYFSQTKSLLDDITSVLKDNTDPKQRGLKAEQHGAVGYWSFET